MKQYCVTTAMGKRLIGKGMAAHPDVRRALAGGMLVIIAGTTNGYVAEEVLGAIGQAEGFTRLGFCRGLTVAPGAKRSSAPFPGDVVIRRGQWERGKTIYDVVDELRAGDVVLKGANAFDARGQPAVQIGHTQGGTVLEAVRAVIGRRAQLIVPVGLEKRVFGDIVELSMRCNAADAQGVRMFPFPGRIFTELDAIKLLTGADAMQLAAGGIWGAEGSAWLGIEGSAEQLAAADTLIRSLEGELPCRV
ncbi:MAG: hypothetical protein H5T69_02145 [Chloroflexi bacterium]|nr:hypothetical protein [Chloroflexota bacterium]